MRSHSTPKGAPACAMASKLKDWDLRNIAKISTKMAKNWPILDFDFLENCPYDSKKTFYSHSTPYEGPICAILSKSFDWDLGNINKKNDQKVVNFGIFDFLKKLFTIWKKFMESFYKIELKLI